MSFHSHMSRTHGIRAELSCVGGTQRANCGREFWATSRLKEHVRQSKACLACYVSADLGTSTACEQVGDHKQRAWKPPIKGEGPQPFCASLDPIMHARS